MKWPASEVAEVTFRNLPAIWRFSGYLQVSEGAIMMEDSLVLEHRQL